MSIKRLLVPLLVTFCFLLLCSLLLTLARRAGGGWWQPLQANTGEEALASPQSDLPQQGEMPLVRAVIADALWGESDDPDGHPGACTLEVVVWAMPLDEERFEMHHGSALNPDRENRRRKKSGKDEDRLRTRKGMGPVKRTMIDPQKQLLLYDYVDGVVFSVTDPTLELTLLSSHGGVDEQGQVVCRYRYRIDEQTMGRLETLAGREGCIRLAYTGHISVYDENAWAHIEHGSIVFSVPLPDEEEAAPAQLL